MEFHCVKFDSPLESSLPYTLSTWLKTFSCYTYLTLPTTQPFHYRHPTRSEDDFPESTIQAHRRNQKKIRKEKEEKKEETGKEAKKGKNRVV